MVCASKGLDVLCMGHATDTLHTEAFGKTNKKHFKNTQGTEKKKKKCPKAELEKPIGFKKTTVAEKLKKNSRATFEAFPC